RVVEGGGRRSGGAGRKGKGWEPRAGPQAGRPKPKRGRVWQSVAAGVEPDLPRDRSRLSRKRASQSNQEHGGEVRHAGPPANGRTSFQQTSHGGRTSDFIPMAH